MVLYVVGATIQARFFCFFFNKTATTEIYTLSLHDALPISVPRLMPGQGTIVGVGALDFPAEWQAADHHMLAELGVSKVITLSSTYDHRIIQGAESGEFLHLVHGLLLGENEIGRAHV